jgi:hypothetical protein
MSLWMKEDSDKANVHERVQIRFHNCWSMSIPSTFCCITEKPILAHVQKYVDYHTFEAKLNMFFFSAKVM